MTLSISDRIDRLCIPEPNSGCWLWLGNLNGNGYGHFNMRVESGLYKKQVAHRVSWLVHRGSIPERLNVLHRCDNRCCINPDHLFLGTHKENMEDMVVKGRHRSVQPVGEDAHLSKLTEAQARYVLASPKTGIALAAELGVSKSCISSLRTGYSWKHLHKEEQRN